MKNKIGIIIAYVLIVIVCGVIIGGFIYQDYYMPEKIYNRNIMKVVEVKVSDDGETWGYATGCFIDNQGTILTNKHVVYNSNTLSNYKLIQVRLASEEEFISATVKNISNDYDLATIKIDYKNSSFYKFNSCISNGQTVYTIGNPNGFGLSFTSGVVSSSDRNIIYNDQTINAIQTDFVINEGNSGGPVFNKYGELVGLISFRIKDKIGDVIQGVSFAIPVESILKFLEE